MFPTTNDVMRVRTPSEFGIRVVEIGTPNQTRNLWHKKSEKVDRNVFSFSLCCYSRLCTDFIPDKTVFSDFPCEKCGFISGYFAGFSMTVICTDL
jgi:hypothetical protein